MTPVDRPCAPWVSKWAATYDCLPEHVVMDQQVRRILADEWRLYRELRLEALKDSPLAFVEQYDDAVTRGDRYWQDRVERDATSPASSTFVAMHAGMFIGKASCFVEPEITKYVSAHVVGVYVTPQFRGQPVAEALMVAVLRWAREQAAAVRIRLFVLDTNDRAAAFYRRVGFVPTGATVAWPPNPAFTEHEMEYARKKTDASASAADCASRRVIADGPQAVRFVPTDGRELAGRAPDPVLPVVRGGLDSGLDLLKLGEG